MQVSDKIAVCQPIGQLSDASPHLSGALLSRQYDQDSDCQDSETKTVKLLSQDETVS